MAFLIEDARNSGIWRLFLNATAAGEPLYRELGFHEQEEQPLIKRL